MAQAILTAAIIPNVMKRSRNHVRRNCQYASVVIADFSTSFLRHFRGCIAPGMQTSFLTHFYVSPILPTR